MPLKVKYDTFASAPDLHEISAAGGFWHSKSIVKVLELKTFRY